MIALAIDNMYLKCILLRNAYESFDFIWIEYTDFITLITCINKICYHISLLILVFLLSNEIINDAVIVDFFFILTHSLHNKLTDKLTCLKPEK